MGLITITLLEVLLFLIAAVYLYAKWKYRHWAELNVPCLEPTFPFGTMENPLKRKISPGEYIKKYYDYFKQNGYRYGGTYQFFNPVLLWIDPELVKNVLTRDFSHFTDRGLFISSKSDPLSGHLFNLEGKSWRRMRIHLTPTFTSGKMKMMFQTLVECSGNLIKKMDQLADDKLPVDIKEVLGCYTTDIIGSCAFGIECNSFSVETSEFRHYGRKIFESSLSRILKFMLFFVAPKLASALGFSFTDKSVQTFFINAVKDTVEYREKNELERKDFLQLLIDLKNKPQNGEPLTIEELTAQCFVFFVAGFETSSTTMTFALYELSSNEEVQSKVREEVNEVLKRHDGIFTYEAIKEMKYLDQSVSETLRKYPPVPVLHRKCTVDYTIPDTNVVLKKGTRTIISVLGLHYDPEYFEEPNAFKPERFDDDVKQNIPQYAYLPFGDGPRNCIGLRFGLMQSKVGLATLLKNYHFSLHDKTVQPLRFDPRSFILTTHNGMWLSAKKIN